MNKNFLYIAIILFISLFLPRFTYSVNEAKEDNNILAETDYGVSFPSVLCKDNILGTQFHPEKSQKEGVDFLKKFLMWKP